MIFAHKVTTFFQKTIKSAQIYGVIVTRYKKNE